MDQKTHAITINNDGSSSMQDRPTQVLDVKPPAPSSPTNSLDNSISSEETSDSSPVTPGLPSNHEYLKHEQPKSDSPAKPINHEKTPPANVSKLSTNQKTKITLIISLAILLIVSLIYFYLQQT